MVNALYFTYDGISSQTYNLLIADFDGNAVMETEALSPELSVLKPPAINRFFKTAIRYESAPTFEFTVVSEAEITAASRAEILAWLVGRHEFKPLVFQQDGLTAITYNCIFTSATSIFVNGYCHGFTLVGMFDSPYAHGADTYMYNPASTSTIYNETNPLPAGTHTVSIENKSTMLDEYTYPLVTFTGGSISIINTTDDSTREFKFEGLGASASTVVDNETKIITSTAANEPLSKFTSKKWLRLRKGVNTLNIVSDGTVVIKCPQYITIGF